MLALLQVAQNSFGFKPDVGIVADAIDGTRALIEEIGRRGHNIGDLDRIATAKATANKNIRDEIHIF